MEQHGSPSAEVDWLHPSAALALFEPGVGMVAAPRQLRQQAATRYGFRIGGVGLLIHPGTRCEVLGRPLVSPMPTMPPGFLGLLNLRGNLVPLYELHALLGKGAPAAGGGRMALILGAGETAVGILVNSYPSALSALQPLAEMPPVPDALAGHASAAYAQDDQVWLEFDHDSFFDSARDAGR